MTHTHTALVHTAGGKTHLHVSESFQSKMDTKNVTKMKMTTNIIYRVSKNETVHVVMHARYTVL